MQIIIPIFAPQIKYENAAKNTDCLDIFGHCGGYLAVRHRTGFLTLRAHSLHLFRLRRIDIFRLFSYSELSEP